jgi:hypothetical protein
MRGKVGKCFFTHSTHVLLNKEAESNMDKTMVHPVCYKSKCSNKLNIAREDRFKVFYCEDHELSNYYNNSAGLQKGKWKNKWFTVTEVSPSGKRVKLKTGSGTTALWRHELEEEQ